MGNSRGSMYRCNSYKTKVVFDCNLSFKCGSMNHISRKLREKSKSMYKLYRIASRRKKAIKIVDKTCYSSKNFLNNVWKAIKNTDESCCCCTKYVNNVNKFNKVNCKKLILCTM